MAKVNDLIQQDRNFIYGQGGNLERQAQERLNSSQQGRQFYRSYGDEAYDPLIGGRGGYTPEEADSIRREDELQGLLPGEEDYDANYLGDAEKAAINGNPWQQEKYYNPDASNDQQNDSAAFQRGARTSLRSGMSGAINEPDLRVSEGYTSGVDQTLGNSEDRVRGAADPDLIRQDPGFADRARMSPEEQQRIVTGAGISAGTGYRAAVGDLQRQASAAGVDPAGAAAMQERLLRQGAGAAGDAMTQARIGASDAAYGRERDIESGRRAGETDAAQIGSGNELALGGQRLSANDRVEALRLSGARDIGDRNMTAAQVSGQADIAGEQAINAQGRQVQQFNQGLGTELAVGQERDAAERSRLISENRQRVTAGNTDDRYGRGYQVNSELTRRNAGIAGERRADAQEGRGYLVHQNDAERAGEATAAGQQIATYGTQGGLAQGTAQQQATQENQPKWWEKAIGAATGVLGAASGFARPRAEGGVIDKPTMVLAGEQGPEAIVPLGDTQGGNYGRPPAPQPQPAKRPQRFMYGQAA